MEISSPDSSLSQQNFGCFLLFLSISTPYVLEQCLFPRPPKKSKNAKAFSILKATNPTNGNTPCSPHPD